MIDSHAHINYFDELERDGVIHRAFSSGVSLILNVSTEILKIDELVSVARRDDRIFCSLGTHPHHIDTESDFIASDIINIAKKYQDKIIGIGETGLDFFKGYTDSAVQKRQFVEHINAAIELKMPIIIHTRDANSDTLDILSQFCGIVGFKPLIHCFTGDQVFLHKLLDVGCCISYSGIVTFKNAKEILQSMLVTPLDKILIETDSPYLAPVPYRGQKNEPAFVRNVAEFVANSRGMTFEDIVSVTTSNFNRLFFDK
jgi:TatD DNase family protein